MNLVLHKKLRNLTFINYKSHSIVTTNCSVSLATNNTESKPIKVLSLGKPLAFAVGQSMDDQTKVPINTCGFFL